MALEETVYDEALPAYYLGNDTPHTNILTTSEKGGNLLQNDSQKSPSIVSPLSPISPKSPNGLVSSRPKPRRKNSGSSTTTTRRPQYSRKYSTPPSRPLSPVGYPRLADVPELDLQSPSMPSFSLYQKQNPKRIHWHKDQDQHLTVDTAPQEPDIFEDPETDYFTSSEIPAMPRARRAGADSMSAQVHIRGSSALHGRQRSLARHQIDGSTGLDVDSEWSLPPTPGSFVVDDEMAMVGHRRQVSTANKASFAATQRMMR